jgi:glycosyltransferase involved in cell wall biosynthesis
MTRILLAAHAAWRTTGYGAPVLPWAREMKRLGHEVAVLAVEERGPGRMVYEGLTHYLPQKTAPMGETVIGRVAQHWKAQVIVSLIDPWALGPAGYAVNGIPWIAWCPVDQSPPQQGLVERLRHAALTVPFSTFGAEALQERAPELNKHPIPLGVDTTLFSPNANARKRGRELWGMADSAFVVGMVAANLPADRKALAQNVGGFCEWARTRPEAHLVLWTQARGGVNLPAYLAQFPDEVAERVKLVDPAYFAYTASASELADFYNSLEVLLSASAAEGFGLTPLEALACGVPVIGAENSAMPEMISERVGWLVREQTPEWSWLDGWWKRPTVLGVATTLERAYLEITSAPVGMWAMECRARAKAYSWELVGEIWGEVLNDVGQ